MAVSSIAADLLHSQLHLQRLHFLAVFVDRTLRASPLYRAAVDTHDSEVKRCAQQLCGTTAANDEASAPSVA